MRIRSSLPLSLALLPIFTVSARAQVAAPPAAALPTEVPALVAYSGVAVAGEGKLISGDHPATFLIYKDQQGGEPLFTESQMIRFDEAGRYKAQLGASNPSGLPSGLFASGEARWLEVQIAGEIAQPRVLLASVPYALKAADAATLGGLPASAFVLAGSKSSLEADPAGVVANAGSTVTTTGGVSGYLPRFNGASTVVDSKIFDTGTDVGIGTATPTATLDVNGTAIIAGGLNAEGGGNFGGSLNILATGNATASAGKASQPLAFVASAYSSSSKAAVAQIFRWTAEPTGNDTASPSGALELLFSSGSGTPTATGLSINAAGQITFAPGQSLPGADIAGAVNASSYELGGSLFAAGSASTESAYLGFAGNTSSTGVENTGTGYLALNSDTTGTDNTATGALALSNNTTGGYNTATGLLALYGNTTGQYNTASGASTLTQNTEGLYNTASGASALTNNVDGSENTASGSSALYQNTDGDGNTAVGVDSLPDNTIGSYNTGVGYEAEAGESMAGPVNNATAIGAHATVNQSNSLILGQTTAGSPGASYVNVGIGTATPRSALEVAVNAPSALGPALTLTNSGQGGAAIDFNTGQPAAAGAAYTPAARILAYNNGAYNNGAYDNGGGSSGVVFQSRGTGGLRDNLVVDGDGGVHVPGALDAAATSSRIDHPLDPANKYLVHSSVQSSEMMNIYTGNIVTDELGLATVKLPDWFEAENSDFRYQLTVMDERFAQAVVSKKIQNGQFTIHTNASKVEVSWQITAVRRDAYAEAHPLVVEQQKPASERGFYLHPELYGQSAEKQAGASRMRGQPASAVGKDFPVPARREIKLPARPNRPNPADRPASGPAAAPHLAAPGLARSK